VLQKRIGPDGGPGGMMSMCTSGAEPGVEGAEDEGAPLPEGLIGCNPGEPGCAGSEETGVRMSVVVGALLTV